MSKTFITLVLTLACTSAAAEQMYQWIDQHGGVQYSQQPPANRPYQQIDIRAALPPGGSLRAPVDPVIEEKEDNPTASAGNTQVTQTRQELSAEDCAALKANLTTLENNPRLSRTNASGEVERIGEDERQEMIRQTRENIEGHCQS